LKKNGTPAVRDGESEIVIEVNHKEWNCVLTTRKYDYMSHVLNTARTSMIFLNAMMPQDTIGITWPIIFFFLGWGGG